MKLLNKKAMDEYDGLEFESAKKMLLEAVAVAQSASVAKGPTLTATYVNLGVVCGAGLNDRLSAVKHFTEALRIDQTVSLDPARSTPVLEEMFKSAKESLGPAPGPTTRATLQHTPRREAPESLALRIRARVTGELGDARVLLYFRTSSGAPYEAMLMLEDRPGRVATIIPANRVEVGSLFYYVELQDSVGHRLQGFGTPASPLVVAVKPTTSGPGPGPGPGARPRRKTLSIGVMVGAGFGVVAGGTSDHQQPIGGGQNQLIDIKSGGAVAPLHVAPEVSYHLSDRWELSVMGRIQVANFTSPQKSDMSFLGLARAKWLLGTGSLRYYVAFNGGGGYIRHRIPLGDYDVSSRGGAEDETPNDIVDSRAAGVGAFGVGAGLRYMFASFVGLVAEVNGLILVPDFAANADLNTGLVFSF
jgi:hypothetical protein